LPHGANGGLCGKPVKDCSPLNNNRGNNRRRGRGNNNRQNGGGQQLNRIDSRARGNAPQLLEKYRKLAHDAHLNGDRVMEEYYLQFADHYFRVIADTRTRQEEQRARREDRWQEGDEPQSDESDDGVEGDYQPYDRHNYDRQDQRNERPAREDRSHREDRPSREDRPAREDRAPREERAPRDSRPRREERFAEPAVETAESAAEVSDPGTLFEPAENPFVRDNRSRGLKPRRDDRRPRREPREADAEPAAFDASVLPPSISAPAEEPAAGEDAPAPKRRGRPPRAKTEQAAE